MQVKSSNAEYIKAYWCHETNTPFIRELSWLNTQGLYGFGKNCVCEKNTQVTFQTSTCYQMAPYLINCGAHSPSVRWVTNLQNRIIFPTLSLTEME